MMPSVILVIRVGTLVLGAVVAGTALPVWLHVQRHGFDARQAGLAFFLWLNTLVALWEICLGLRIDLIEAQHRRFADEYRGRPLDRVRDFFLARVPLARALSPSLWAEIWSSYALFDPSYADRRSFGFFVDVGNGLTT